MKVRAEAMMSGTRRIQSSKTGWACLLDKRFALANVSSETNRKTPPVQRRLF
jgi:hypothetical protein